MPTKWKPLASAALLSLMVSSTTGLSAAQVRQVEIRTADALWVSGSLDGADAFGVISDVHELPDGTVAVLDRALLQVTIVARNGDHTRSFGRSGRGPGEFLFPISLDVRGDTIVIVDPKEGRANHFTPNGGTLASVPLPHFGFRSTVEAWPTGGGGWLYTMPGFSSTSSADPATDGQHMLLWRNAARQDTVALFPSGHLFWEAPNGLRSAFPQHVGPGMVASRWLDGGFVIADGYTGRLDWYEVSEHGPVVGHSVQISVDPTPVTKADEASILSTFRTQAMNHSGFRLPASVEVTAPRWWSGIANILVDPTGRLWVAGPLTLEGPGYTWRIVTKEGVVGSVVMPQGLELLHVGESTLYARGTTDEGAHTLWAFPLHGGAP